MDSETMSFIDGLREDLNAATERIHGLEERVASLERQAPQARQAAYEADIAAADLAESGLDGWPDYS